MHHPRVQGLMVLVEVLPRGWLDLPALEPRLVWGRMGLGGARGQQHTGWGGGARLRPCTKLRQLDCVFNRHGDGQLCVEPVPTC